MMSDMRKLQVTNEDNFSLYHKNNLNLTRNILYVS